MLTVEEHGQLARDWADRQAHLIIVDRSPVPAFYCSNSVSRYAGTSLLRTGSNRVLREVVNRVVRCHSLIFCAAHIVR